MIFKILIGVFVLIVLLFAYALCKAASYEEDREINYDCIKNAFDDDDDDDMI